MEGDFLVFLLINFWLLLLLLLLPVTVPTVFIVSIDLLLCLCSVWLTWAWSELVLKVRLPISMVNNHFRSSGNSLEISLLIRNLCD